MIFVRWFVQICKDSFFWLINMENNCKIVLSVQEMQFFSKKSKKTLARNEISCTFAAAFRNE